MRLCKLRVDDIETSREMQARVAMSDEAVNDYAEAYRTGAVLPPVVVFYDGSQWHLADGFHRVLAAKKAGIKKIPAEQHDGTSRDAQLHAIGANASHGLRRTNADKRRAVDMLLKDEEWAMLSNREIARLARVSHQLVNNMRPPEGADVEVAEVATVATSEVVEPAEIGPREVATVATAEVPEVDPLDMPGSPFAGLGEAAPVATVATPKPAAKPVAPSNLPAVKPDAEVAKRLDACVSEVGAQRLMEALGGHGVEISVADIPAVLADVRDGIAARVTPRLKATDPAFSIAGELPEWVEERARVLQPIAGRIIRSLTAARRDLDRFLGIAAEGVQEGQLAERRFVKLVYALEASNEADPIYSRPAPRVHRSGAGLGPLVRLQMALVAFLPLRACDRCNGTGEVDGVACGRCEGTGSLGDDSVKLPAELG